MATLFNEIFSAIRGKCISDESASVATAEVIELVEEKFTSTNKQSTPCCVCGVGAAELCGKCHAEIVSSVVN